MNETQPHQPDLLFGRVGSELVEAEHKTITQARIAKQSGSLALKAEPGITSRHQGGGIAVNQKHVAGEPAADNGQC